MGASPESKGTSSLSLPYSLPSTPIFPPLLETTLKREERRSVEELQQRENPTTALDDREAQVARVEENASLPAAGTHQQQSVQQQRKQDDGVQETTSQTTAEGSAADKASHRRASTLRVGSADMPSSLLRPLDHEEERKALLVEQQFRKERMAALRRQNELRRRRHAEKQQQLRAAAAQERAAALENRHKKLQAARVLMERGLAAAAGASHAGASAAVDRADVAATRASVAPGLSCAPSATGNTPVTVAPASAVWCHRTDTSPSGATACSLRQKAMSTWATSDSHPTCLATSNQAPQPPSCLKPAEQHSAHQLSAPRHKHRSSSEFALSSRNRGANRSHVTPSTPPNAVTQNVFIGGAGAEYRCFPDVSTIAECIVAGAAMECKGAVRARGSCRAAGAGEFHCQATQEILSLWPYEHRRLLNASVNNGERLVLLQNENVDRLVLATSISHQTAEQRCVTYPSAASECEKTLVGSSISLQRLNTERKSLPPAPAFATSRSFPIPRAVNNIQRRFPPLSGLIVPATFCSSQADGNKLLNSQTTMPQNQGHQQTQQHQKQRPSYERPDNRLQQQGHTKAAQRRFQESGHPQHLQRHTASVLQHELPPCQEPPHEQNQPREGRTDCLLECNGLESRGLPFLGKQSARVARLSDLQVRSWSPEDHPSPTVLGTPGAVYPGAPLEPGPQQQESEEKHAHRTALGECSPCGSAASGRRTDNVQPNSRAQHAVGLHEQSPQLLRQQRQRHKQQQQLPPPQSKLKQQQRGSLARISTTTRKKSYAGQFASAMRAEVDEEHQPRWKHSRERKTLDPNKLQGPPCANVLNGAPASAGSSAVASTGFRTCPSAATSPTGNPPIPLIPSLPTPNDPQTATGPETRPDVPFPLSITSAACSAVAATDALERGVSTGQTRSNKSHRNGAVCSSTSPTATHVKALNQIRGPLHYTQSLHQDIQRVKEQKLPTQQQHHQKPEQGSHHNFTGVHVVDRKLKALIEQQLKDAAAYPSDVVADSDQVFCVSGSANNTTDNAQDITSNGGPTFAHLTESTAQAAGAAAVPQAANEARLFDLQENTSTQQIIDSQLKDVCPHSLLLNDASTRQQLQLQQKQYRREHQPAHPVNLQLTDRVQEPASQPQYQWQRCRFPQNSSEGVEAESCRLHRRCGDSISPTHCGTSDEGEQSKTARECSSFEDVHKGVPNTVCGLPENEDACTLRIEETSPSMRHDGKKFLSTKKQQDGSLQSTSQSDDWGHITEKAESPVQQFDKRVSSALSAEEDLSVKQAEEDVYSARPLHEYSGRNHGVRNRRQRVDKQQNVTDNCSPYKNFSPTVRRVRETAATGMTYALGEQEEAPLARCPYSKSLRATSTKVRHLPHARRTTHDSFAGSAASMGAEECNEKEEMEVDENTEVEDIDWESSRAVGKRDAVAPELDCCTINQDDPSVLEERNMEAECSKRRSLVFFASPSPRLSRSASCTSPPRLNTNKTCANAGTAFTKHCKAFHGSRSSSAVPGAPRSTRPSLAPEGGNCYNHRQADDAASGHRFCSTRCPSRSTPSVPAAGDRLTGKKSGKVHSGGSSSNCCAACNSLAATCGEQAVCSVGLHREVQQQQHRDTAASSPLHPLSEKQRKDLSPASRGSQQPQSERRSTEHAYQYLDGLDAGPERREISGMQYRSMHSAASSSSSHRSCRIEAASQEHHRQQQQPEYVNGTTGEKHEGLRVKLKSNRCASVTNNARSSTRSCTNHRPNPAVCKNSSKHRSSNDCNKSWRYSSAGNRSNESRSSPRESSSSSRSRSCSEHSQGCDQRKLTSLNRVRERMAFPTAARKKKCRCGSFSPRMPASPRSSSWRVRTHSSTSVSRMKSEVTHAMHCSGSREHCSRTPQLSRSNSSSSTWCGSSGESLDSGTLCCVFSRRSSNKLPLCVPPAHNSLVRNLPTRSTKKGLPKKCNMNKLKLQALTNAEKKVEERLLILDVNQKTLDEQHERRRYLQQQHLQQQQQLLLEQQQQLQQQQQLLTLVQYQSLPPEDGFNPCTSLFNGEESALSVTTPQSAANGNPVLQRGSSRVSVKQPAAKSGWTPSTDRLEEDQHEGESLTNKLGTGTCTLQPSVRRMSVPVHSAASGLFPPSASFTASSSTPVTVPLITGPPACSQPAKGSLRARTPVPTAASMTLTAPSDAGLLCRAENEQKLLSVGRRHSQALTPVRHAESTLIFPPLRRGRSDPAKAIAAGPVGASNTVHIPRTGPAPVMKSLPPGRRAAAAEALPPLRARTSSWTRRPQPLTLLSRIT